VAEPVPFSPVRRGQAQWITSPAVDAAVALCWLPLAVAGLAVGGSPDGLAAVLGGVFLLSFLHQPLTLPLVYGDSGQLAGRRRLFTWTPVVFVVAVLGGLWLSLTLVAIVAGLWNAEHTLMQRYGITRIYGRKVGDAAGPLEKAMLVSWLVLALVWVAADPSTESRIDRLPLGRTNANGLHVLTSLRPWAAAFVLPLVVVVVVLAGRWIRDEVHRSTRGEANPAKQLYVLSTAALFGWVVFVDPLSGLVGYVGAHSIEYFVIVHRALGSRFADGSGGSLGALVRRPGGRGRFLGGYVLVFVALVFVEKRWGGADLYSFTVLFLGGLHVFYDSLIWKLRRPQVAAGLVSTPPQPEPEPEPEPRPQPMANASA
jgi:hypothetical protein